MGANCGAFAGSLRPVGPWREFRPRKVCWKIERTRLPGKFPFRRDLLGDDPFAESGLAESGRKLSDLRPDGLIHFSLMAWDF